MRERGECGEGNLEPCHARREKGIIDLTSKEKRKRNEGGEGEKQVRERKLSRRFRYRGQGHDRSKWACQCLIRELGTGSSGFGGSARTEVVAVMCVGRECILLCVGGRRMVKGSVRACCIRRLNELVRNVDVGWGMMIQRKTR